MEPELIETTTLYDERKFYRHPSYTSTTITLPRYDDLVIGNYLKPEEPDIRLEEYCVEKTDMIAKKSTCNEYKDLSPERIFRTISIMKSKLIVACAPYHIDHIKCKMTPAVKKNLITAYRKINMFGKKTPFVARFDEYGNRLPDVVKIDTLRGMDIEILNPAVYGEFYMSFETVIEDFPF